MTDRPTHALRHLSAEFSLSPTEFRREHQPGGDMLLTGLINNGYAHSKGGRVAVSDMGRRKLKAEAPAESEA